MKSHSGILFCRSCGKKQIVVGTVQPCEVCHATGFDSTPNANTPLSVHPLFSKIDVRFLKSLRISAE